MPLEIYGREFCKIEQKRSVQGHLGFHQRERTNLKPVQRLDVIERVDGWAESTVQAEYLRVHEGSQREIVEKVGEVLPDVGVAVLAQALVVEPVNLGDLTRLVVATEDGDPVLVAHLEKQRQEQ